MYDIFGEGPRFIFQNYFVFFFLSGMTIIGVVGRGEGGRGEKSSLNFSTQKKVDRN